MYRIGPYKELFPAEQLVCGKEDAANNFARGKYSVGPKILGEVMNQVRKLSENCHSIQGFMLFHSVGGGTGSGLTSVIIEQLAEIFPKTPKFLFGVFPAALVYLYYYLGNLGNCSF